MCVHGPATDSVDNGTKPERAIEDGLQHVDEIAKGIKRR